MGGGLPDLLQYYNGGGSLETPNLYYVIYGRPLMYISNWIRLSWYIFQDVFGLANLDWLMVRPFVESHTFPSPAKALRFYDNSICGLLIHVSTWTSCHRCRKNVTHRWYDLLPHGLACSCMILLFHKHCILPKVLFQGQLIYQFCNHWLDLIVQIIQIVNFYTSQSVGQCDRFVLQDISVVGFTVLIH